MFETRAPKDRRKSEHILSSSKDNASLVTLAAIQDFHKKHLTSEDNDGGDIHRSQEHSGPDNDLDTYKQGLLPTQDLQ